MNCRELTTIGPRIPHTEEVTKLDDRAELVLILFKPWRVYTDLRTQQETWPEALLRFETECGMYHN